MNEVELSPSEWKVAEILWVSPGLQGVGVCQLLPRHLGWKLKTVNTFLARMVRKGFLRTERVSRAFRYFPIIAREDMLESAARDYLGRSGEAGQARAVAILLKEADLSPAEIRALRKKLKERV